MQGANNKNHYVGEEAMSKRDILDIKYPIKNGIVTNWEDMERVWHHTLSNELCASPEDVSGVLVTEAPHNPSANREKMVTILFESFGFHAVAIALQPVMSLYNSGRSTGLVVDSGEGFTHTVPVYEGSYMPAGINKIEIAGRAINDFCKKLLLNAGLSFTSSLEKEIL